MQEKSAHQQSQVLLSGEQLLAFCVQVTLCLGGVGTGGGRMHKHNRLLYCCSSMGDEKYPLSKGLSMMTFLT